jgi:putative ABC transport system ATP-binding protein
MLSVRDVTKTYRLANRPVHALIDVSLEVSPGEIVVVNGPSGAGKTTLLLTAGSLLAPDAGTVEIDGHNPYDLAPDGRAGLRREMVGFVFQQYHLLPYLTVADNVLLAAPLKHREQSQNRAQELMARFGIADRKQHLPGQLSVGQKQRVALARAVLNAPKLIVADEPTGNLDEANAKTVLGALADLASQGAAVLLVTHDKAAAPYAHRELRLDAGRLTQP